MADSVSIEKLAADVQALNSKLEVLEEMMSQRRRRENKRLRDAKKQSRRSHTRLQEEANPVRTRLERLERSQQEANAYSEGLQRRDMEMAAREKEMTARENKIIALQEEIIAQQKQMAAHQKEMAAQRTGMIAQRKEIVTQQKEMIAREKDMVGRQKDMAARQEELDERERLVSMRSQAIAEQAMAFAHTPVSMSQQETTTASEKKPSEPRIQEHAMAISDTLKVSRSSTRSVPSAARAATAPAILQHPQSPRGFLPPETEVQKSNSDELHSTLLRTLTDLVPYTMSAIWKDQLNSCQQTAVFCVDSLRKICVWMSTPNVLTNRIRAWTAQELDKWVETFGEAVVKYDVQDGVSQTNYRPVMTNVLIAATVKHIAHEDWRTPRSVREDV